MHFFVKHHLEQWASNYQAIKIKHECEKLSHRITWAKCWFYYFNIFLLENWDMFRFQNLNRICWTLYKSYPYIIITHYTLYTVCILFTPLNDSVLNSMKVLQLNSLKHSHFPSTHRIKIRVDYDYCFVNWTRANFAHICLYCNTLQSPWLHRWTIFAEAECTTNKRKR